ncbi:hypothetical protein EOM57_04445 [Candidatus Saccharibacteria bacterium]|nr:hypothetical protein [Candidatus Saccharibacteria bacterium]
MANPTLEDGTLARRKPIGEALGSKDTLLPTLPVGQHNTTPPNLADGDVAVLQIDDMGNIKVAFGDPAQEAMLNQIQNAIAAIRSTIGIAADLRVTLLSGTVTTVSSVTNVVAIGGLAGLVPMNALMNLAYIQSNGNNIA